MTNLDSILKSRHYFANKGPSSEGYSFSSSHVWMWELDHKEGWMPKNLRFWIELWCLRRLLRVPWTARRSNQSILKEINPEYSFPMSWLFASGGQSTGLSASTSVLSLYIPGWFPLGLTALISLQSKGLSRVFSNTTVQKHQFFDIQPSSWSNSHIQTWLLEKP